MTASKFAFEHSGKTYELNPGETLIGSGSDCGIQVEGKNIESVHAAVVIEDGHAVIQIRADGDDIRVNGKPTRVEDLQPADKIRIGEVELATIGGDPLPVLEGGGETFPLKNGENTVGRSPEAAITLDDDSVSREHASILALPSGRIRIRDLMSSNGTFVNDRRLGEIPLSGGDTVEIGGEKLVFLELKLPAGAAGAAAASAPSGDGGAAAVDLGKTRIASDFPDLDAIAASMGGPDGPTYELKVLGETRTLALGIHKIGRAPDCQIQLTDDSEVSRYHSQLDVASDRVLLKDLGSSNGTRVNGQKIEGEVALASGDRIGVGGKEMAFRVAGPVDLMGKTMMAEDVLSSLGHTVLAPLGDLSALEALKDLPEDQREALNLLEMDPGATEDVIRSRFKELYSEFQVRTTNAPTPELKKKYERRVEELRHAVEVLIPPTESQQDLPSSEPVEAPAGEAPPPPPKEDAASAEAGAAAAPAAPKKAAKKKKEKKPKEKKEGGGIPAAAYLMMVIALVAATAGVFVALQSVKAGKVEQEIQAEFDTKSQDIASMLELIPQTQQSILEIEEGKAALLENMELKICNLSRGSMLVTWLQAQYVGSDQRMQSFNSANYFYPTWPIPAGGTGKFRYIAGDQVIWNGSAVFFSATINYQGRELFRSGAIQAIGPDCYNLKLD